MNENLKQAILKVKEMAEVQEKLTKAETLDGHMRLCSLLGQASHWMNSKQQWKK